MRGVKRGLREDGGYRRAWAEGGPREDGGGNYRTEMGSCLELMIQDELMVREGGRVMSGVKRGPMEDGGGIAVPRWALAWS